MSSESDRIDEAIRSLAEALRWFRHNGTVRRTYAISTVSSETLRLVDNIVAGNIQTMYDLTDQNDVREVVDACLVFMRIALAEVYPLLKRSHAGRSPGMNTGTHSDLRMTLDVLPHQIDRVVECVLDLRIVTLHESKASA